MVSSRIASRSASRVAFRIARPLLAGLFVIAGASCASSSGAAPETTSVQLGTSAGEGTALTRSTMTLSTEAARGTTPIAADLGTVWQALQDVLSELEFPITQLDTAEGRLQVDGRMPRVDRKRMSHWFDCGRSMTGPVADRSTVSVAMAFQLQANSAGGTLVEYSTRATAAPRYNQGNTLACSSEGRLEAFIVEAVTERVGTAG